ncbi:LuxR family transcriptional regulator [Halomonas caseinilytica]|uniref:LuxR family transcriptional regulator n=1 Tax=Halomonas caseinilytica TaxID=438744 RepID=UPI0008BC10B1|nr:LuxR family transcriptional regulator [Halomonas caseinilytica]SEN40536.1 DNA-binding transcriptional regulator, CsgD family [Halomonas caseinilytica]
MGAGGNTKFSSLYENHETYIIKILRSETKEELLNSVSSFVEHIGFNDFIYACFLPSVSVHTKEEIILSGYPDEWRSHYIHEKYSSIDPVVFHCNRNVMPVNWSDINFSQERADVSVMNEAKEFGLVYGWTIPLHGAGGVWSLLSIASSSYDDFFDNGFDPRLSVSFLAASAIHTNITENYMACSEKQSSVHSITAREREVVAWAAEGKTIWETSMILGISESTVRFHLNHVSSKLGANNKVSTVSKAILYGVL